MMNMTKEQMNERVRELGKVLDSIDACSDEWDTAYSEYCNLTMELDEIYRQENQDDFDAFYQEHIAGKTRTEIDDETWGFYSDWHKDMYGHRPRL